jgi:hypothetical protein
MATVMAMVVLMLVLGVSMLSLSLHGQTFAIRSNTQLVARSAADAGLEKVLCEMNQKLQVKPWNGGTLPSATDEALANCNAVFGYSLNGDIDSGFNVAVTGQSARAMSRIDCLLKLHGPFESAILTRGNLILKAGTVVTGYNSKDPGETNVKVSIATTSTASSSIVLNNGVTVDGDVLVGVDGNPSSVIKDLGATVGDKLVMGDVPPFPSVVVPTLTDKGTSLQASGGDPCVIGPADNGIYNSIELKRASKPGVLSIEGGEIILSITGDVKLGQDCEIVIAEGASLTLYLKGNLNSDNNSGFNNLTQIPGNLRIYGTSAATRSFDIKAKSKVFGAVYAPNADVTVYANGDVYGSFVARSFELKAGSNFYYDKALKEVTSDDPGTYFAVSQWHE